MPITCFDGEGLISPRFAAQIDRALCGGHVHTSFQTRLPYVKGMLHQVYFHDFLTGCGTRTITDLWGVEHRVKDVDVIPTRSMCKGLGWMAECGMSWTDYWNAFRRYRHALYITNVSKERPERFTELNYQFLTTVSVRADEFRPADLPDGWDHSPEEDERCWLTKQTELAYYNFRANEQFRRDYFLRALEGRLIVAGDNRYLSSDLLDFLVMLLDFKQVRTKRERTFFTAALVNSRSFPRGAVYAPGAAYSRQEVCTLLRNPHIARNEEIQLSFFDDKNNMRHYYFHQLTDVVMVNSNMLAAERLGGADYDGDMIKTVADPIINACVRRNYDIDRFEKYKSLENRENIPLLMIPTAEPRIRSAHDWEARFEVVRDTFSSRVGQICNAALDRSIVAYNENSDDEERQRCREETELLAILTGLEIDSAKSGVRPDLENFLGQWTVKRTPFLLEALRRDGWQFLDAEARERFLLEWLPEFEELFDLLTDFRSGGYRVLWDILLDIDQENTAQDRKRLTRNGDSPAFSAMMEAYQKKTASQSYRDAVSEKCRELLDVIVKPVTAVLYVVALGKRGLLWELLPDAILPNVLEVRHAE